MDKSVLGIRARLYIGFLAIGLLLFLSVAASLFIIVKTENNANEVIKIELPVYNTLVDLSSLVFITSISMELWAVTDNEKHKNEVLKMLEMISKNESSIEEKIKHSTNDKLNQKWIEIKLMIDQLKVVILKIINTPDGHARKMMVQTDVVAITQKLGVNLNTVDGQVVASSGILDTQYFHLNTGAQKILNNMSVLTWVEYILLIIGVFASMIISFVTANKILTPLKKAINIAKLIASGQRKVKITIKSADETGELLAALDLMQNAIRETEKNLQDTEIKTRKRFESIVSSANQFSSHSSKVASGDLRHHLELGNDNEDVMKKLGKDLNKMTENLASITNEITQACQYMVSTVEEVRHAIDTQSSGASEQASSINEISASLTEIEKSSTQTMEKAITLGQSAERTREKGQQGLDSVDKSIEGMKKVRDKVQVIAETILDLSSQTQKVGEITSVVNNLAQQSKMLALNASIEAAKAGEAGKGFAVVAVEVKNLAEQSEQATTQVQKILENIRYSAEKAVMVTEEGTKGVDEGAGLVEQTGDIIRNLNAVIHETMIASQQIESAVRQESAGIEQITTGMNEINQVTASFIESVRQTTEAITNLAEIAKNLKSYIDVYKV